MGLVLDIMTVFRMGIKKEKKDEDESTQLLDLESCVNKYSGKFVPSECRSCDGYNYNCDGYYSLGQKIDYEKR